MIATLIALVFAASPPEDPKPQVPDRSISRPAPSATAKEEAVRRRRARKRARALNSRRLAGFADSGSNFNPYSPQGPANSAGSGMQGGSQSEGADYGSFDTSSFGGGFGGFGMSPGGSGFPSSFDQQLSSTYDQAAAAMAAGQAAAALTNSLT
ncbi:hypothetical protein P12x_004887 [Tundrisphaera lichenicola]|uniref:hypothetical protein n=1 Tax=Tundrisphaera lichenicola TaxID=2029860 RepID=UPI003EBFB8A8